MKEDIKVLMSQAEAWAQSVSVALEDEISFRRIIISREIFRELKALEKMLNLSLEEMQICFMARCAWRQLNKEKNIAFSEDPDTETNRLYFNIACLLFKVNDLKTLLSILMPNAKHVLKIVIPDETPVGIHPREVKECHQHDIPLLSVEPLDRLATISASVDNLKKCVFHQEMVFFIEESPLINLTLDWHIKCYQILNETYPGLAKKLYQHNEDFLALKSDILQSKEGLSPAYVFKDLVWGLRLGGKRVTGDELNAGASAMSAIARFYDHYEQWPIKLQEALGEFKISYKNIRNLKELLLIIREPNPVDPICVEVLSQLIDGMLTRYKNNHDLCNIPVYSEDEMKRLYERYRHKRLDAVKDTNIKRHYPLNIIRKISTHIEISSLEHFFWILKSISTKAYQGLFKGLLSKLLQLRHFSIDNLVYVLSGEMFNPAQKKALFFAITSAARDSHELLAVNPLLGSLFKEISTDEAEDCLIHTSNENVAISLITLLNRRDIFTNRFSYLKLVSNQIRLPVLCALLQLEKENFAWSKTRWRDQTFRSIPTIIMSQASEIRAEYVANVINLCLSVSHDYQFARELIECIPKGTFIEDITKPFGNIASILETSCHVKKNYFLKSILKILKKEIDTNYVDMTIKETNKNLLHCITDSDPIAKKFNLIRKIVGERNLQIMSAAKDSHEKRPIDYAVKRKAFLVLLQGWPVALRFELLKNDDDSLKEVVYNARHQEVHSSLVKTQLKFLGIHIPYHLAIMSKLDENDAFHFSKMRLKKSNNQTVMVNLIQQIESSNYYRLFDESRITWFYSQFKSDNFINKAVRSAFISIIISASSSWVDIIKNVRAAFLKDLISDKPEFFNIAVASLDKMIEIFFDEVHNPISIKEIAQVIRQLASTEFTNGINKHIRLFALIKLLFSKIDKNKRIDFLVKNKALIKLIVNGYPTVELRWMIVDVLLTIYLKLPKHDRKLLLSMDVALNDKAKTVVNIKELLGGGVLFIPDECLNSPRLALTLFEHLTHTMHSSFEACIREGNTDLADLADQRNQTNCETLIQEYGYNREKRGQLKDKVKEILFEAFLKVDTIDIQCIVTNIREYYHHQKTSKLMRTAEGFSKLSSADKLLLFLMRPFSEKKRMIDNQKLKDSAFFEECFSRKYAQSSLGGSYGSISMFGHIPYPVQTGEHISSALSYDIACEDLVAIEGLIQFHNVRSVDVFEQAVRRAKPILIDHMVIRNFEESDLFHRGLHSRIFIIDTIKHGSAHLVLPKLLYLSPESPKKYLELYTRLLSYISNDGDNLFYLLNFLLDNGFDAERFEETVFNKGTKTLFEIIIDRYKNSKNEKIINDSIKCLRLLLDNKVSPLIGNENCFVYEELDRIFPNDAVLETYRKSYETSKEIRIRAVMTDTRFSEAHSLFSYLSMKTDKRVVKLITTHYDEPVKNRIN